MADEENDKINYDFNFNKKEEVEPSSSSSLCSNVSPSDSEPNRHVGRDDIWRIYPPPGKEEEEGTNNNTKVFQIGDVVCTKTKSAKEMGQIGIVVAGDDNNNDVPPVADNDTNAKKKEGKNQQERVNICIISREDLISSYCCSGEKTSSCKKGRFVSHRPSRLIPVYNPQLQKYLNTSIKPSSSPDKQQIQDYAITNPFKATTILITAKTASYRQLASSQILPHDSILEIGCSMGECTSILTKYAFENGKVVGIDISNDMVQCTRTKIFGDKEKESDSRKGCVVRIVKCDPFLNPLGAKRLATWSDVFIENENDGVTINDESDHEKVKLASSSSSASSSPNCVFIDIGGNRALHSVVQMIAWVQNEFSPRLVVVKSEELVSELIGNNDAIISLKKKKKKKKELKRQKQQEAKKRKMEETPISRDERRQHIKNENSTENAVNILGNGQIDNGNQWFQKLLQKCRGQQQQQDGDSSTSTIDKSHHKQQRPHYIHPLKAPMIYSPEDKSKPICRYHNYHKDGCKRYKDKECPLDHVYCHWCLQPGHIALHCGSRGEKV